MINFLISCCFEFKCIIPNIKNIFKNTEHLENQSRAMGSFSSILAYIDKLTITCLVAGSREVLFHKESCHDCEVLEQSGKAWHSGHGPGCSHRHPHAFNRARSVRL